MKYCSNCGKEIREEDKYCPNCGTMQIQEDSGLICDNCGSVLPEGFKVCPDCGSVKTRSNESHNVATNSKKKFYLGSFIIGMILGVFGIVLVSFSKNENKIKSAFIGFGIEFVGFIIINVISFLLSGINITEEIGTLF